MDDPYRKAHLSETERRLYEELNRERTRSLQLEKRAEARSSFDWDREVATWSGWALLTLVAVLHLHGC